MAKCGILHDYDLRANDEESAVNQTCVVCGASPMLFQWSDYNGEAMCTQCGCPYQLMNGTDTQKAEGKYPYLNIKPEYVPILKEYWEQTEQFACHGLMVGPSPGLREFNEWLERTHPEVLHEQPELAAQTTENKEP